MSWEILKSSLEMESNIVEFLEEIWDLKNEILNNENRQENPEGKEQSFWWITLKRTWIYEVPWITESGRLTKNKWVVQYKNALVVTKDWKSRTESHKETFYSQKKMPWKKLNIPGRHIAEDGTIRDREWYIVIAAPLKIYPRGTRIMTTLWPGKVYDTWYMKWKWVDIYTNR